MRARLGLHRRAGGARGFSLVELVVAILVLSIGTVGALRAFQQAGRDTAGLTARQLALQVAQSRADEIRDQLAGLGWEVRDGADGARLVPRS